MAMMVIAAPILPGKIDQWRTYMEELNGARHHEFVASRHQAGIRERTFLASTPYGPMAILVWEGDHPERAIAHFMGGKDEFSDWQLQLAREVHGFDPSQTVPALPVLVLDSHAGAPIQVRLPGDPAPDTSET